jgi:hypothetical protein
MTFWLIVSFLLAAVVVGALVMYGLDRFAKYREREAMRVRNDRLSRFNITPFRGTKNRWLS